MARHISVRVGYIPPSTLGAAPADACGLSDQAAAELITSGALFPAVDLYPSTTLYPKG